MYRFTAALTALTFLASCGGSSSENSDPTTGDSVTDGGSTTAGGSWLVVEVVDGDTLWVQADGADRVKVRAIGYDTPEQGECGFDDATTYLANLIEGKEVTLESGGTNDVDKYGRLLRYVNVNGKDVGTTMIEAGLAIARYDGIDGYEEHPKQNEYRKLDMTVPNLCP